MSDLKTQATLVEKPDAEVKENGEEVKISQAFIYGWTPICRPTIWLSATGIQNPIFRPSSLFPQIPRLESTSH